MRLRHRRGGKAEPAIDLPDAFIDALADYGDFLLGFTTRFDTTLLEEESIHREAQARPVQLVNAIAAHPRVAGSPPACLGAAEVLTQGLRIRGDGEAYRAMMRGALNYVRAAGVPWARLRPYLRWLHRLQGGTSRTWESARGAPAVEPGPVSRERATRLLDAWDRALGDDDLTWGCLEDLGRLGRFASPDDVPYDATYDVPDDGAGEGGLDAATYRPWRWLDEASAVAQREGDDVLAARLFLLAWWCVTTVAPKLTPREARDLGFAGRPRAGEGAAIQARARRALDRLPPHRVLQAGAAGRVTVATARDLSRSPLP